MGQETDTLKQQIAATRDELDMNLRRLESKVQSGAWKSLLTVLLVLSVGFVLYRKAARRARRSL